MHKAILVVLLSCSPAVASEQLYSVPIGDPYKNSSVLGVYVTGKGKANEVINFDLTNEANAMLHGFVPHEGDTVEWYVRPGVNCSTPEEKCEFTLGLRAKQ